MATERGAEVTWTGDLLSGGGTIGKVGSGAFGPLDVSWAARSEEPNGKTSPEELIAAAWASCFAMALSAGLARGERRRGTRHLRHGDLPAGRGDHQGRADRPRVRSPASTRRGSPSRQRPQRRTAPVSQALAGIPDVTLDAALD